jgi:hypothetical protein
MITMIFLTIEASANLAIAFFFTLEVIPVGEVEGEEGVLPAFRHTCPQ